LGAGALSVLAGLLGFSLATGFAGFDSLFESVL
jgi:hypothetical protein